MALWCHAVMSCSAGGGQRQTAEAGTASDGVMRTANGQIIRAAAAAREAESTGDGPDVTSLAGAVGESSEVSSGSDVTLNQPDAGLEPGDPDDDIPPGPAASRDPIALPEPSEEEEEDEEQDEGDD